MRVILLITAVILVLAALPGFKIIDDVLTKKTAYQFMIENKKLFTVSQKDSLEKMLDAYKKHYLAKIDKHARVKNIGFTQKVEIVEVEVRPEEIDTLKVAKEKIYALKQKAVEI